MRTITFWIYTFCIGLSVGVTAWVYSWEVNQTRTQQFKENLEWARQVAVQVEGLAMIARTEDRVNPVGWAAAQLNRGLGDRRMKVFPMKVPTELLESKTGNEFSEVDWKTLSLDYARVFSRGDRSGVRIQIRLYYRGFLGTTSRLANDLSLVFLFIVFMTLFMAFPWIREPAVNWIREKRGEVQKPKPLIQVDEHLEESRELIKDLSVNTRDLLKDAHTLLNSSVQAKKQLDELQRNITVARQKMASIPPRSQKKALEDWTSEWTSHVHTTLESYRSLAHTGNALRDKIRRTTFSLKNLKKNSEEKSAA